MKLTDVHCRNARSKDVPYKLADGHGLYLYVAANGSRLWRMDYAFDGKRKTLSLGAYPIVGLSDVRVAHEAARRQIAPHHRDADLAGLGIGGGVGDEDVAIMDPARRASA